MAEEHLPAEAERWLATAAEALARVPQPRRDEILDGLRAHLHEALIAGENVADVLQALGSPEAVGSMVDDEFSEPFVGAGSRGEYWSPRRWVQLAAVVTAVAAAVIVAFMPGYVSSTIDSNGNLIDTQTRIALFNMSWQVGLSLGLAIIFSSAPLAFRGATWKVASVVCAVLMVALTAVSVVVASNWFVLPPMLLTVVALFAPTRPLRNPKPAALTA